MAALSRGLLRFLNLVVQAGTPKSPEW